MVGYVLWMLENQPPYLVDSLSIDNIEAIWHAYQNKTAQFYVDETFIFFLFTILLLLLTF